VQVPTVGDFRGQEVFTADGSRSGTIGGVHVASDGQYVATVDFGDDLGARQVPISRISRVSNLWS
jgi:hypothetical protein